MKIVNLINPKQKRSLASITQAELEYVLSSTCDAARNAIREMNIGTGAAEFLGFFHAIEAAIYASVKDAKETVKND